MTPKVMIELDADTARAFKSAPQDKQEKMRLLVAFWLREFVSSSTLPLPALMDDISAKAEERGLTPKVLKSLLDAD